MYQTIVQSKRATSVHTTISTHFISALSEISNAPITRTPMFRFTLSSIFACTLFITAVGCSGSSEPEVIVDLQTAANIQAERDARDKMAAEQAANEMKSAPRPR
ncbi:hypothetical protein [Neorhodopirellula lusitana]|uniref:hypothetical protein n=1 Tax=Neorhodopirellula lusitana TaxID=445327 RepID=UPI00384CDD2C